MPAADHELTLLTKPGCGLCGPARDAVARVHAATGVRWREVDVTTDAELEAEYAEKLPVVLLDGEEHDVYRVAEARLLRDVQR